MNQLNENTPPEHEPTRDFGSDPNQPVNPPATPRNEVEGQPEELGASDSSELHAGRATGVVDEGSRGKSGHLSEPGAKVGNSAPILRTPRGADPSRDTVWTRNHTICLTGAICDIKLGGYDAARSTPEPLKSGIRPSEIPVTVLTLCPWLLRVEYLNFEGNAGLQKRGLVREFHYWASNRVTYFYRNGESGEHPCRRRKANLGLVYREFYDTFERDIVAGTAISEERAKEFWLLVNDRVPFLAPRMPEDQATSPEVVRPSGPPVSAPEGESRNLDNTAQEGGAE